MARMGKGDRGVKMELEKPRRGWSWSRVAWLAVAGTALLALGGAVKYAEDNQLFSSNTVSWCVFVAAGLCAYWALLGFVILLLRHLKNRRR